jgi:hypothetical protein
MVWLCKQKLRGFFQKANLEAMAVGIMFIAYFGLVFTQQIVYATGYGMYNPRYLLPAWVVAGIVIGMGMLIWQRRGVIAVATMAAGWAAVINWLVYTWPPKLISLPSKDGFTCSNPPPRTMAFRQRRYQYC